MFSWKPFYKNSYPWNQSEKHYYLQQGFIFEQDQWNELVERRACVLNNQEILVDRNIIAKVKLYFTNIIGGMVS